MTGDASTVPVFNMLPMAISSRLPAFRSLRRSASLCVLAMRKRPVSLEPEKVETLAIRHDTQLVERKKGEIVAATPIGHPHADKNSTALLSSGIKWPYYIQAHHMQQAAARESADVGFVRKSYIDGVAYMLQALPDDLNDREQEVIRQALPETCAPKTYVIAPAQQAIDWSGDDSARKVSLLQRSVAMLVASIFHAIYMLWLLTAKAVCLGAQYERQYHITQQVMGQGLFVATVVGKHSAIISSKIISLSDGRIGRAMADFASKWIESVTAGIQDGVGQGLLIIEQRRREATLKENTTGPQTRETIAHAPQ
ncbi:hypothetical protein F5Y15DRAFT_372384 [Xylariaceae sp. FL0016]|nr:hypothetical protein F5Y15DRAFT_372384 [Xylariaceae sp. FL0016]